METERTRVQTGLRFTPALINKLKVKAKRNNKSFNRYVEDVLEKDVELEFPHLRREDFIKEDKFSALGKTIPPIPQDVIDSDPKLSYLLGR